MTTHIDIHEYIKEYEKKHPLRKEYDVPTDPSRKWWFMRSSDPVTDCIDRCKFRLYQTALSESGVGLDANKELTYEQRIIHARYANLQSECTEMCKSDM